MTKTLCMNPGPIAFEKSVLEEFKKEGISHVDKQFIEVFGATLEQMRKVFLAPDGQPLVVAGSGTLGWDMVGDNLLEEGNHVLVINTGYFGDTLGNCLERYGAKITHLKCEVGSRPSLDELTKALNSGIHYKIVTITHVDTSTGVLANVADYAAIIRKLQPHALIVVDGVCATGGEECRTKDWDLDVVLTGSQKCIAVPAGLSLLVIRPRALQAMDELSATKKIRYYCDWNNWLPIMKNYEGRRPSYFATPAVNHIYALHRAFEIMLANGGIEKRFEEHRVVSGAIKNALRAMGCSFVPETGSEANTLTCVRYPLGVNATDFLPKVYQRGISLAGGLHSKIKTEYFRIGHMGPSTRRLDHAIQTIKAIEEAFIECGYEVKNKGRAVAIIKELKSSIPITPCCSLKSCGKCPVPPMCQVWSIAIVAASFAIGFAVATARHK